MALTIQRTIYTGTNVQITPKSIANALAPWTHAGLSAATMNTVQNATFSLNIPRADVNVFGVEGVIDRPQLEAETGTFEFSFVPELNNSVPKTYALTPVDLNALIADTIAETPDYVFVGAPKVGKIKDALMNSATGEATVGALANFTLSFTGSVDDKDDPADRGGAAVYPNATAGALQPVAVKSSIIDVADKAKVVTPKDVILTVAGAGNPGGSPGNGALVDEHNFPIGADPVGTGGDDDVIESCAQSASFSWDVPVELILCLGADPADDGVALGNPPGTSSITVEALKEQLTGLALGAAAGLQDYKLQIGDYTFTVISGNIDSRTHNLAVGDLFGSYNYVIGGTGDGFTVA